MFCAEPLLDVVRERASSCAVVSVGRRSWKLLYSSPPTALPRPWTTGSFAELRRLGAHLGQRDGLVGVVNVTCVPPLKSIPRFRPLTASAPIEIATIAPEIANQR